MRQPNVPQRLQRSAHSTVTPQQCPRSTVFTHLEMSLLNLLAVSNIASVLDTSVSCHVEMFPLNRVALSNLQPHPPQHTSH